MLIYELLYLEAFYWVWCIFQYSMLQQIKRKFYLDPSQFSFRPQYSIKVALVVFLIDYHYQRSDRKSSTFADSAQLLSSF